MAETDDFNIQTLAHFFPPNALCEKCLALLQLTWPDTPFKCPVCSVEYTASGKYGDVGGYLRRRRHNIEFDNILEHCKALADPAVMRGWDMHPPLRTLLETISLAKQFVHFTSFGIGDFFIGALKLTAQRVPVRGVVSNVDERIHDELTAFEQEAPSGNFQVKDFLRDGQWHEAHIRNSSSLMVLSPSKAPRI